MEYLEEELYLLLAEIRIVCLYLKICYCWVRVGYCRAVIGCYQVRREILAAWKNIKRACLLVSLRFIVRQLEQTDLHD